MSLEDAKPVRQIDRTACNLGITVLTVADKQDGLKVLIARFVGCSVHFMQTNLVTDIIIARTEADDFILRMISQPK